MFSIVAVLVLGTAVSVVVGHLLQQAGRPFLEDVLRDERVSAAVARLLAVMFHLVALGTVALIGTIRLDTMPVLYATSLKLGLVLLVIGGAHGLTLFALLSIKKRRRQLELEQAMAATAGPSGAGPATRRV